MERGRKVRKIMPIQCITGLINENHQSYKRTCTAPDYVNYLRPTTYVYLSAIFYKVKVLHPVLTTKTVKRSKIFQVNIYYISIYRKLSFFLFIFFINERSHLKKCVNLRILAESTCSIFLGFISVGASSQNLNYQFDVTKTNTVKLSKSFKSNSYYIKY